ncbi:hypothetical protein BGZ94_004906 [Podila epigama]|nr:hypothetical protein BGZ94_004906 [Podila epigama]
MNLNIWLNELADLLAAKMPSRLNLPRLPFPDAHNAATRAPVVQTNDTSLSELLIDFSEDTPPATIQSGIFIVDNTIQDPYMMYYPTASQKIDLPDVIASQLGCTSTISPNAREITIKGSSIVDVNRCLKELQDMQDYFLRPKYQTQRVTLVYGSTRDPFRVILIPLSRHRHFANHIKFFPSDMRQFAEPSKHLVAIKASYDSNVGDWLPDERILIPLDSRPQNNGPGTARQAPQGISGRVQPMAEQGWGQPGISRGPREWYHESDIPGFGFGFSDEPQNHRRSSSSASQQGWSSSGQSSRRADTGSWPSPGQASRLSNTGSWPTPAPRTSPHNQSRPGSSVGMAAPDSGPSATQSSWGPPNQRPLTHTGGGAVRKMGQPQWEAPAFESRDENDFPSLAGPSSKAGGKAGKASRMPQLPPVRRPGESSSSRPNASSPGPVANESLIFDDQAFDFLENRSSSPRVNNSTDLSFPSLDPAQDRHEGKRTLRVLPSQKSDVREQSTESFLNNMRSYNMGRLTRAMWAGLEELRGHRQEIRLIARLGKVVYRGDSAICGRSWDYEALEKVVIKDLETKPLFSPITTTTSTHINNMFGFLGQPSSESGLFEVICDTRTNPQSRYSRTLITVPPTVAILERVVAPWETYAAVTWNSMDKFTDFEIALQARQGIVHDNKSALGRTDVKPFVAFRKSLSIGTHNRHISCREVPDRLEIKSINYRETQRYTIDDNTDNTILVHTVQELQCTRTKETNTVTARSHPAGKVWYEIEVMNERMNRFFETNLTLTPGLVADWKASDLLGNNPDNSEALAMVVRYMMRLVDECQNRLKD